MLLPLLLLSLLLLPSLPLLILLLLQLLHLQLILLQILLEPLVGHRQYRQLCVTSCGDPAPVAGSRARSHPPTNRYSNKWPNTISQNKKNIFNINEYDHIIHTTTLCVQMISQVFCFDQKNRNYWQKKRKFSDCQLINNVQKLNVFQLNLVKIHIYQITRNKCNKIYYQLIVLALVDQFMAK